MAQQKESAAHRQWQCGQKCEIFSRSQNQWVEGEVVDVFTDEEGEWVKVKYGRNTKEVPPNHEDIRLVGTAEQTVSPAVSAECVEGAAKGVVPETDALRINKRPHDDTSDDDDAKDPPSGSAKRKHSDSSSSRAGGPMHIPCNVLTEFQEKQLYGEYYLIRRDIIAALDDDAHDDGSWGPILVRLAWHSSGTFDAADGSGGSSGATMRFRPEMDDPENKGLRAARDKLVAIKEKYGDQMSWADLWIFASYIAIEAMGGPYIRFAAGRSDEKQRSLCPANGRLPSAEGDGKHIRSVFNRMGFNDQEIVVLIGGGHVLGRCHKEHSGYDGPWVDNPTRFSNEYFEELFENEWEQKTIEETGNVQWKDEGDELMMLRSDMMMLWDEGFKEWSQIYHDDSDRFMADFAAAFKKLTELGCHGLVDV